MATRFNWNPLSGRYTDATTGRFVSFASVKDFAIEPIIARAQGEMQLLLTMLRTKEISIGQWQTLMMSQIKQLHVMAAVAARGGLDQMSPSDWGVVGAQIKNQYIYLRNFAKQIESGKQPLNGFAIRRVQMYAEAVRSTFEQIRRRVASVYMGATEEIRVLGPAEHCHTDGKLLGCSELAEKGWQPIMSLPRIGETPCRTNCRCKFKFRKEEGGKWVTIET